MSDAVLQRMGKSEPLSNVKGSKKLEGFFFSFQFVLIKFRHFVYFNSLMYLKHPPGVWPTVTYKCD